MIRTFTERDINELFHRVVKKDLSYFDQYHCFEDHRDGFIETLFDSCDVPRIPCLLDFKKWVIKHNINPTKMLSTWKDDYEHHYIKSNAVRYLEYNSRTGEGDLHTFKLNEQFDFFLFTHTLEHLYNPLLAVGTIYQHIAPGGWVFTSVPTISIPHMTPSHFCGLYPMGLAILFESVGFTVKEMGQWGNKEYIEFMFEYQSWPTYNLIKDHTNILLNEEQYVAQCWCLAQK